MMCGRQDYICYKNASFIRTVYLKDANDVAIDLTGCTATFQIRVSNSGAEMETIYSDSSPQGITITAAAGQIDIELTQAQTVALSTAGLPQRTVIEYKAPNVADDVRADGYVAYYALELEWPNGEVDRLLDGQFCIVIGGTT